MTVSIKMCILYTSHEISLTLFICFPKELLVRWASDVYEFNESQITATVELVTESTFEVDQVIIQGFPRQIPDDNPNRIDSLVVPGPFFPGEYVNEVKQLTLCSFHTRHLICSLHMYKHL